MAVEHLSAALTSRERPHSRLPSISRELQAEHVHFSDKLKRL